MEKPITIHAVANHSPVYRHIKAVLDILVAFVLLLLLLPLLLLLALLIRLDSPGPAIYRQTRVGRRGRPFIIYKFRTMKIGTPLLSTAELWLQGIQPFTNLGSFLRKTSLDELPQLLNVLKGEMSFIGPRPALLSQTDVNIMREQLGADESLPGITGLAQVMGRDGLDNVLKVKYDKEYQQRMSILLDMRILWLTFLAVMTAKGNK